MGLFDKMTNSLKKTVTGEYKPKTVKCRGLTLQPFGMFPVNDSVELQLIFERSILIFTSLRSKESVEIPFDRLLYYRYYSQSNSHVTSKGNVVGRAIVGNILFGKTGALIGGLTAKEKSYTTNSWFFHLGYIDMYGNAAELIFADQKDTYLYNGSSPQKGNTEFEFYVNDIYNHYHGTRTI